MDTTFAPGVFGFDLANGKAHILGTGDEMYSLTATADIASSLGALLTTVPASKLTQLKEVRIQGDRVSFDDVVRLYEHCHPKQPKIEVTYQPVDQAQAEHDATPGFTFRKLTLQLRLDWVGGNCDLTKGGKVEVQNGLVPDWKPASVAEYLARL